MNFIKQTLLLLLISPLFTSCNFINNAYKDTTKEFVDSLIEEDYEKSLSLMSLENDTFKSSKIDTLKSRLANFQSIMVRNFGKKLNYKFMSANKTFSTVENESTAPNTTKAQIEFSNDKEFGVLEIVFDDTSNKIISIKALDVKEKIPNMTLFWLFGFLALLIPVFNIWIITKIKRSNLKKKWLKYIAVISLNVPSITYSAVSGVSINLLSFQMLCGISFSYMGYLSSLWEFGIPLGGFYWLWKLNKRKNSENTHISLN